MREMDDTSIKPVVKIKLRDLADLARFASTTASVGHTTYVIHYVEESQHIYGLFIVYRDYYRLYGVPMFYYITTEKPLEGNYILFRADDAGEHVEVREGSKPGWIAIPIVNLDEKPAYLLS